VALKLQELKDRFGADARISHLDGISIDHDTWRFNVRPSNTEPLVRLNLEAQSHAEMISRRDEVLGVIRG
jgi:phosphomannomutase